MSFSWENLYLSGFNTGSALSGIQKYTPIYLVASGLKFDGSPVTSGHFAYFTGKGFSASGTLPNDSGIFGYNKKTDDYRAIIAFTGASGLYATGAFEFYWNSGATTVSTGFTLVKGFELFNNKTETAWDVISRANGSVNNADGEHSHAAFAQYLYDLDDVFIPGSIPDGNVLIYFAASGGWTTGEAGSETVIVDIPVDGQTTTGISSNWAYDHKENPTDINHLTDTQVAALHAIYTDAEAIDAVEAADLVLTQGTLDMTPVTGTPVIITLTTSEDAYMELKADMDDDDETKHAWISFFQDGVARFLHIGVGKEDDDNEGFITVYEKLLINIGALGSGTKILEVNASGIDVVGNITVSGTVDTVDISAFKTAYDALSITNMPTAVNNWKVYCTNGAGVMTEVTMGVSATVLTSNGTTSAPTWQAVGGGADPNAIHVNVAGEIDGLVAVTPTTLDKIVIEDQSDSWNKKETPLGEIDIAGDVTGKLSATVVGNDSHTHNTQYFTEAEMNAFLHIGTANKVWVNLTNDGAFINEYVRMDNSLGNWYNRDGSDFQVFFSIPMPLRLGTKHLHVDYIYVYLYDADGSNYLNDFSVRGKTDASTSTLYNSSTNQTTVGNKSYSTGTDDWGDYERVVVVVNVVCATGAAWEMSTIQARCWYA